MPRASELGSSTHSGCPLAGCARRRIANMRFGRATQVAPAIRGERHHVVVPKFRFEQTDNFIAQGTYKRMIIEGGIECRRFRNVRADLESARLSVSQATSIAGRSRP